MTESIPTHGSWIIETLDTHAGVWEDVTTPADKDYESASRALLLAMNQDRDVRITWSPRQIQSDNQTQLF